MVSKVSEASMCTIYNFLIRLTLCIFPHCPCLELRPHYICIIIYSQDIVGFGDNDRGVSFTFGANEVSKFLKRNNLSLIVRAHQVIHGNIYGFFD